MTTTSLVTARTRTMLNKVPEVTVYFWIIKILYVPAFYWLTVLVTFALGTAVGDWTLELTGWSAGVSVLLPLGLILAVLVAWKAGAGPVLSFWLAYILTRPLGANIGDFLASSKGDGGLGLGTLGTSVLFLGTILAVVVHLTVTDKDRTEAVRPHRD